jgi:tRNA nucleotidyltransferase/poly(A) polymerase
MTNLRFPTFLVGGAIRDELRCKKLGIPVQIKDFDFAVEAPSFEAMGDELVRAGFEIFKEDIEHFTIKAHFPRNDPRNGKITGDFVVTRTDGPSSDGRHPDFVVPGTILEDLARRDFTVNAMARNVETGEFLDPHNGRADLETMTLRFVGDPEKRISEDFLRVLRAVRFKITKGFTLSDEIVEIFGQSWVTEGLVARNSEGKRIVSLERIQGELNPCFRKDTLQTIFVLQTLFGPEFFNSLFSDGLRLEATFKK